LSAHLFGGQIGHQIPIFARVIEASNVVAVGNENSGDNWPSESIKSSDIQTVSGSCEFNADRRVMIHPEIGQRISD